MWGFGICSRLHVGNLGFVGIEWGFNMQIWGIYSSGALGYMGKELEFWWEDRVDVGIKWGVGS